MFQFTSVYYIFHNPVVNFCDNSFAIQCLGLVTQGTVRLFLHMEIFKTSVKSAKYLEYLGLQQAECAKRTFFYYWRVWKKSRILLAKFCKKTLDYYVALNRSCCSL